MHLTPILVFALLAGSFAVAEDPVLHSPAGTVTFSPSTGAIIAMTPPNATGSVWQSGENGLWSARFANRTQLNAARFHATNTLFRFSWQAGPDKDALTFVYTASNLAVNVVARPCSDGIELSAEVAPAVQTLLRFDLPGRLRFSPASVKRFVFPHGVNTGPGAAFTQAFFERYPDTRPPATWKTVPRGPEGYRILCGAPLIQRDVIDPAVSLTVTDEGRRWLPPSVAARIAAAQVTVNRASTRTQADLVIADSINGPYLSANRLGGRNGGLWRIGGGVREEEADIALTLVSAVIEKLANTAPSPTARIGLVRLANGPPRGAWCEIAVDDWRTRLIVLAGRSGGRVTFVELDSPQAMLDAARQPDFLCILNPYGEALPVPDADGLPTVLEAIRNYVKAGGNWFEVGGYSFFQALLPCRYLSCSLAYPTAFADFMHLESRVGTAALYRVQPRTVKEPWGAAKDTEKIFVPGLLGCGGDELGGFCDHGFNT